MEVVLQVSCIKLTDVGAPRKGNLFSYSGTLTHKEQYLILWRNVSLPRDAVFVMGLMLLDLEVYISWEEGKIPVNVGRKCLGSKISNVIPVPCCQTVREHWKLQRPF